MKKGVYLLIGTFALIFLFTNFVSAVCYGSNTASCTASTYSTCNAIDGCQWNDNSYCEGPEECLGIPYEPACTNPCIWYENAYCSKLSCSSLYSSQCDDAPGCTWVDGNGEFALADASSGASDYCHDYIFIDAVLGAWEGWLYDYYGWSTPTLSSGTFTYGGDSMPFITPSCALELGDDSIIINGPAKSGDSTRLAFFRNPVEVRHSDQYNYLSELSSTKNFIYISHDDWNNICSADEQILYYYSYMYVDDSGSRSFTMYADDDGWVNFYHLNPTNSELISGFSIASDWGECLYPECWPPNGIIGGSDSFSSGWYLIEIALQEDGGDQELVVVTGDSFQPSLGYLGWDGSEVVETCDRLAGSAFDRTDCDDYPVRNVCTYSGYDWHPAWSSYPNGCCGDDGASDVGVSYGSYACTQCSATVSGVGDAGDYVWVISEICDNEIDDDCDGLTDCSDTNDCLSALPTDPCYTCEPACTGKECGDDSCGGTCPPGCDPASETCISGNCQTTNTCETCLGYTSYYWCVDDDSCNVLPVSACTDSITDISECAGLKPIVYWADENENRINTSQTYTYYTEITTLKLVAINLEPGIEAIFEIYEDDSPFAPAEIRVGESALPTTTVNSEGVAVVNWTISSLDLQEALQRGNDPPFELYFKVNDNLESEELVAYIEDIPVLCEGISRCANYDNSADCNNDLCTICISGIEEKQGEGFCDEEWRDCKCSWEGDDATGKCKDHWASLNTVNPENPDLPSTIGTCTYTEDTGGETCGEGVEFIGISWVGNWDWGVNDFGSGEDPNGGDYVFNEGAWHYDPLKTYLECTGGSDTFPCPAQIELPFFGLHSLIIIIALIVLVYIIWNLKKHKTKKRKKK